MAFELAPVGQPATVQTVSGAPGSATPLVGDPLVPGIPGGGSRIAQGVRIGIEPTIFGQPIPIDIEPGGTPSVPGLPDTQTFCGV